MAQELKQTLRRQQKLTALRNRLNLSRARTDTREWMVKRREWTRHLIELGGLVIKAKLDELTADDRTVIYGALLILAAKLKGADAPANIEVWRRHGKRAFEAEAEAKDAEPGRRPRARQGQAN